MRFAALAVDYDGTLASQGRVFPETVRSLKRFAASGRKLLLVTGRELEELIGIFPEIGVFDRVVAENGALLFYPRTGARKPLGIPPPPEFVSELVRRGVDPLSVGASIVATVTPNEKIVLETIRDLGLELQVIFNKGAVMVLPAGVNKASGLAAALDDMKLSARNVAAIGDAENDHALLRSAEFGVAVANALPMLKRDADRTSALAHGAAVSELMDAILADDLRAWAQGTSRRGVLLGHREDRTPLCIAPARCNVLLAGPSGSGKSVYAAGILERLAENGYQYCAVDPEGDYADLPGAVVLGSAEREPSPEEVVTALENPHTNVVINLSGLAADERPAAFKELVAQLATLRATCGRPHWILVGEAQFLLPAEDSDAALKPNDFGSSMMYVSVHPESMSPAVLGSVDALIGIGANPTATLAKYCGPLGLACAVPAHFSLRPGEAVAWMRRTAEAPLRFAMQPSEAERKQHRRRLVEGQLPAERSFYFRGAQKKLNLRAQNLPLFLQIGMGVDEETWLHHLRQGDYSRWLQESVKDTRLATEVAEVERSAADAAASRARVTAILEKYMKAADERATP
ncbi:MAG: HAD-IIB family hydrolase [Betaproteobacteria bacterium]|nr:HAD-IIB family hydrolase [Betaproteobacteria bacterium]